MVNEPTDNERSPSLHDLWLAWQHARDRRAEAEDLLYRELRRRGRHVHDDDRADAERILDDNFRQPEADAYRAYCDEHTRRITRLVKVYGGTDLARRETKWREYTDLSPSQIDEAFAVVDAFADIQAEPVYQTSSWPGLKPGPKHGRVDDAVRRQEITNIVTTFRADHDNDDPPVWEVGRQLRYKSPKAWARALRAHADVWLDPALNWPPAEWWKRGHRQAAARATPAPIST